MIACLNVPYFAATVEKRDDHALAEKDKNGLVIGGQPWEPQPLYAFSREVARQGVKPGMSLRLAHFLSPHALFLPAHPPRYFDASGEITDLLADFTHLFEPEELWLPASTARQPSPASNRSLPARYTLDLESLPQAEAISLAQQIGQTVRQQTSLAPAIGLAESKFTAQVAAALTRPNHLRSVATEKETQFLADRSIFFLPLDRETARRLSLLGIRTLGQLTALPLSSLQAQFGHQPGLGTAFATLYRLAQGYAGHSNPLQAVQPLPQDKQERLTRHFETPLTNVLILKRVLARMAQELSGRLQAAGLEGQTLHLAWEVERDLRPAAGKTQRTQTAPGTRSYPEPASNDRPSIYRSQILRRPTANAQRLTAILHELFDQAWLEQMAHLAEADGLEPDLADYGVATLIVTLTNLTPTISWQPALYDLFQVGGGRKGLAVQEMMDTLIARHGADCFYRPILTDSDHPLPERRFQLHQWTAV